MKKIIWFVLIISCAFGDSFGWSNKSDSKYDSNISKYDVGMNSFRFKYESGSSCEEVSIKEREAIISDIKSGRFKMKKHPELKDEIVKIMESLDSNKVQTEFKKNILPLPKD